MTYLLFFSSWYVAQLVLFPATALQLLPLRQQKVQNHTSAGEKKKQCCKRSDNGREEHGAAGGRWFGKLWETAEAWSCVLCSVTEQRTSRGKEDTSQRQNRQSQ